MIITPTQQEALKEFSASPLAKTFYWTGGTLLAERYLHHRKSLDLDLFADESFAFDEVNGFIQHLKTTLGVKNVRHQKVFDRHEFLLENNQSLRIEFVFYNHEKRRLKPKELWKGLLIDSLEDIAANKVMAFFDRNEPKDLFDLYFIITKGGLAPRTLLGFVKDKFGLEMTESSFWSEPFKALDALNTITPLLLGTEEENRATVESVKTYFKDGSANFLRRQIEE